MLDMTGKSLFPDWEQNLKFFFEKNFEKCCIVPKNEKGDPLGFINMHSVAKYQKTRRGDSFETLKNFGKKFRTVPKKK